MLHGKKTEQAASRYKERRDWRGDFLNALRRTGNVSRSAEAAHISRMTAYRRRETDPEFAKEWDEAIAEAVDRIEGEMYRRAVEGVEKPVYYQGKKVGTIKEYSDILLIVLAKAHRPEKYREQRKFDVHLTPLEEIRKGLDRISANMLEERK